MRILIINTLYSPNKVGGAEISVQELAEGLVAVGHSVYVASIHNQNKEKSSVINGVKVYYFPLRNIYWPFDDIRPGEMRRLLWHFIDMHNYFAVRDIARLLDDIEPDVVHTNNLSGFSVGVWCEVKRRGIRLVHTARDYYLFHVNSAMYKNGHTLPVRDFTVRCWSTYKKYRSSLVDEFVGISEFVLEIHKDNGFFPNTKGVKIYNIVRSPVGNISIRRRKDLNSVCIGFIGRLEEEKGYEDFLSFVRDLQISHRDIEIKVVVAGRGKLEYIRSVESRYPVDNMERLGFVQPEQFLNKVDHVVFPVRSQEPFGRAAVECALAGKNVWVAPSGGLKELITMIPSIQAIKEFSFESNGIRAQLPDELSASTIIDKHILVYSGA